MNSLAAKCVHSTYIQTIIHIHLHSNNSYKLVLSGGKMYGFINFYITKVLFCSMNDQLI